jgi:trehalose 6-phosphate synthase
LLVTSNQFFTEVTLASFSLVFISYSSVLRVVTEAAVHTSQDKRRAEIQGLCQSLLAKHKLVVASNRGPVEYQITPDGRTEPRRGGGGVVTALNSLAQMLEFTWIASAITDGDRKMCDDGEVFKRKSPIPGQRVQIRFVASPRRVYHKYYNIFCNPLLWFLQHYMWNSAYSPNVDATVHDAWHEGYLPVNQAFAEAMAEETKESVEPPIAMVHDYHLYLTPTMLRQMVPHAVILHFTHLPWPAPRYWHLIPFYMRKAIIDGLLAADILGFQTPLDVRNFMECCELFASNATVDHRKWMVDMEGRQVRLRVYPISIDVGEVQRIASSPKAQEYLKKLILLCGEKTIVRVDRAEPSKNVLRGFQAFHLLLGRFPELKERVQFLAFLVPSRTHIRQYQRYLAEIQEVVNTINNTFGTPTWRPVTTFLENNYVQALAGLKLYDVLLVNPVIDGMNLVAKEGPVVNTKNGVLILSEGAGAHYQLREACLTVAPTDVEGTMQAMYQALTMSEEERERRAKTLSDITVREDIAHWLLLQMKDVQALLKERGSPTT